jgi:hypothetical protein
MTGWKPPEKRYRKCERVCPLWYPFITNFTTLVAQHIHKRKAPGAHPFQKYLIVLYTHLLFICGFVWDNDVKQNGIWGSAFWELYDDDFIVLFRNFLLSACDNVYPLWHPFSMRLAFRKDVRLFQSLLDRKTLKNSYRHHKWQIIPLFISQSSPASRTLKWELLVVLD